MFSSSKAVLQFQPSAANSIALRWALNARSSALVQRRCLTRFEYSSLMGIPRTLTSVLKVMRGPSFDFELKEPEDTEAGEDAMLASSDCVPKKCAQGLLLGFCSSSSWYLRGSCLTCTFPSKDPLEGVLIFGCSFFSSSIPSLLRKLDLILVLAFGASIVIVDVGAELSDDCGEDMKAVRLIDIMSIAMGFKTGTASIKLQCLLQDPNDRCNKNNKNRNLNRRWSCERSAKLHTKLGRCVCFCCQYFWSYHP